MPIRPEYIFKIETIYTLNAADIAEIETDSAAKKEWNNGYKNFKKNIRTHLKIQQKGRCAFCRCFVSNGTSYSNLEHLVSKSDYPQFEFLPSNLVYCCWICNKSKLKKNSIHNPVADKSLQLFPASTTDFVIINPYIDPYEENIEFFDEVIIIHITNSSKGENTIEYYNLARPELAEERAREFKLNQQNLHQQLLSRLTLNSNTPSIIEQINNIIDQLPTWTL